jgi:hypothetical protein
MHWIRQDEADPGERTDRRRPTFWRRIGGCARMRLSCVGSIEILKTASVYSPGSRPDPAMVMGFVDEHRDRSVAVASPAS